MKIRGYATAVRRQRIFAMPSNCKAKLELSVPSQEAENCNASSDFTNPFPAMARPRVIKEVNNAQLLTVRSFFIKNDSKPPINGTKKSNKTIITKLLREW